jgi:hypothetical protein
MLALEDYKENDGFIRWRQLRVKLDWPPLESDVVKA